MGLRFRAHLGTLLASLALVTLASCGGGGGSSSSSGSTNPVVTPPSADTRLRVSEVSSCATYAVGCWFEVYNPTAATINLSQYNLKSLGQSANNGPLTVQVFSLPSIDVPAGGYVVVSGFPPGSPDQRGTQIAAVHTGNAVPVWSADGFIELLLNSNNQTVDFVKFGNSSQTSVTASQWSGTGASGLLSSSTDYNQSIVRDYQSIANVDTNAAGDWRSSPWSTPGGRNDVPSNAVDADNDGIPDSAETSGGTFGGINLYAMGARTAQRDIFIEVDYMNSSDPGVIPRSESLQKVVDSFAAQGIQVHFDAGTQFSGSFSAASFNLGQGNNQVPYEKCVGFDQTTCASNVSTRRSIWDWKSDSMDVRRRPIFHYALMGYTQYDDARAKGSSGRAEIIGNDLIITMGNWGFNTGTTSMQNVLINMQASTFMHELGHNLGLLHGGDENVNDKPNYWSIMNYAYQLAGLDAAPTANSAYLRWRYYKGDGKTNLAGTSTDICSLPNSPCGAATQFLMSYSNGSGATLDENALSEAANIGRGGAGFADWDLSGVLTGSTISKDLNGSSTKTLLHDFNDWGNLVLAFNRRGTGNAGISLLRSSSITPDSSFDSVTQDRQPVADEEAPPQSVFEAIRNVQ